MIVLDRLTQLAPESNAAGDEPAVVRRTAGVNAEAGDSAVDVVMVVACAEHPDEQFVVLVAAQFLVEAATLTLLGGIQLISMSVLGEYIGLIFTEVKNRPLYIVEKTELSDGARAEEKIRSVRAGS